MSPLPRGAAETRKRGVVGSARPPQVRRPTPALSAESPCRNTTKALPEAARSGHPWSSGAVAETQQRCRTHRPDTVDEVPCIIVIGEKTALKWVLETQRMAFRDTARTAQVKSGDAIAIYTTTRGAFGNPTRSESQIVALGLGRFASDVQTRQAVVNGVTYAKSCALTRSPINLSPGTGCPSGRSWTSSTLCGANEDGQPTCVERSYQSATTTSQRYNASSSG